MRNPLRHLWKIVYGSIPYLMHQIRKIDEVDGFLPQQLSYLFQMVDDGKIQLLIVSLLHEERITTPLSREVPEPQCLYFSCSTSHISYLILSIKISFHCPYRS